MSDHYSGILDIDKPADWTSHDVVARVRRIAGQRRVGHAGTLDPAATGVLLVCLGQATRVAEYLMASDKSYRAIIRLGTSTDTYDAEGVVTATAAVPELSSEQLRAVLAEFTGEIRQFPPAYSAIKQDGVPLHRRARRGEEIHLQARPVRIYRIDLLGWRSPDLSVDVTCGPGTYIRSLANDLGRHLGCGAHLAGLVRTRSGRFPLEEASTLEALAEAAARGQLESHLHPLEDALGGLVTVPVDDQATAHLIHGRPIPVQEGPTGDRGYARAADGQVVAILLRRSDQWWPQKVFAADQPGG